MTRSLVVLCSAAAFITTVPGSGFSQSLPAAFERTIVPVRGDLYRAQDGAQHTVFLVTGNGIILVDPLNFEFASG